MALFVLGALVFLLAAIQANFDAREVWDRIEWADASSRPEHADDRHADNRMAEARW